MKKTLFISKPYGFCFGVKNALKIVAEVLARYPGQKIFIFNEIVHNKTIVEDLQEKSVTFTQNTKDIPKNAIVIFSAHGIAPRVCVELKKKKAIIYDATGICQLPSRPTTSQRLIHPTRRWQRRMLQLELAEGFQSWTAASEWP